MPAFITIAPDPGLRQAGTDYQSKGFWRASDLIRFFQGWLGPIGGWVVRTTGAMTGKVRWGVAWVDATNIRWQAWGSEQKLYAFSQTSTTPSDITPVGLVTGNADASSGAGYGVGPYGASAYGSPRIDTGSVIDASMWTGDVWSSAGDLLACLSEDGRIFRWQRDVGTPATELGGTAPTGCQAVVVTPEGFLVAIGANSDQRSVVWPDQGSLSVWTPASTNQAGSLELQTQGAGRCGARLRTQTLIWTTTDAHALTYVGLPAVYRLDRVGENCGIISKGAFAVQGAFAYWMSRSGFYVYDGGVVRKIPCAIWDDVFADLNATQQSKITMSLNSKFSSFIVRWPSSGSTEINRCAEYNYDEGTWVTHPTMIRLCGVDAAPFLNPIMCDASGYLYDHETGYLYDSATPYARTGPMEIGEGDRLGKVLELIPDEKTRADAQVTFFGKDSPNGAETTYGPYSMADFVDVRFEARQAEMKVEFIANANSRWGNCRLNVLPGGRRAAA